MRCGVLVPTTNILPQEIIELNSNFFYWPIEQFQMYFLLQYALVFFISS